MSDVALNIFRERANRTESSTLIEYERKMTSLSTYIGKQLEEMKRFETELKSDSKTLQDTITKQFTRYKAYVTQSLSALQELIKIISDKELKIETAATELHGAAVKRPRNDHD